MRYLKLYKIAKEIDKFNKNKIFINKNKILELLKNFKPKYVGKGGYKRVFLVKLNKRELIFKVGRDVKIQYKIYLERKHKKNFKYAKIYWATEKCLLQKYCKKVKVPVKLIKANKIIAKKNGYSDWRKDNVGLLNNKIIAFDLQSKEHKQERLIK